MFFSLECVCLFFFLLFIEFPFSEYCMKPVSEISKEITICLYDDVHFFFVFELEIFR